MLKKTFMKKLRRSLAQLPADEQKKTLDYYSELIDDRIENGATEEAATAAMGDIDLIAKEILCDASERGVRLKKRRMPSAVKVILMILAVILVLGILGACVMAAMVYAGFSITGEWHQKEKVFSASDVGTIEMQLSMFDLTIEPSNDEQIHIFYFENPDLTEIDISATEDGIRFVQKQNWYAQFIFNKGYFRAELMIPEGFEGSVKSDSAVGDIWVDNIRSSVRFDLRTSTGDMTVKDIEAQGSSFINRTGDTSMSSCRFDGDIDISATTGGVKLENVSAGELTVSVSTGDILLNSVTAAALEAGATTGNIRTSSVKAGSVNLHASTGDIRVDALDAESITLKASTGSITGTLKGHAEDYSIESHTSTGDNNLPESFGSGERKLSVTTSTGSISISFAD